MQEGTNYGFEIDDVGKWHNDKGVSMILVLFWKMVAQRRPKGHGFNPYISEWHLSNLVYM